MDSFELNKIIASILLVALLVIGLGKLADGVFHVKQPKNPGYQVEIENQSTSLVTQVSEVEEKIDIVAIMALGDVQLEKKYSKNVQLVILLKRVELTKLDLHFMV